MPAFLVLWVTLVIVVPNVQAIIALTCAKYMILPLFPDVFVRIGACLVMS